MTTQDKILNKMQLLAGHGYTFYFSIQFEGHRGETPNEIEIRKDDTNAIILAKLNSAIKSIKRTDADNIKIAWENINLYQ